MITRKQYMTNSEMFDHLPRHFPMLNYLRPRIVGKCREVRVFEGASCVPWVPRFGFDLRFYRRTGYPPVNPIGDFHPGYGWNHQMLELFLTRELAQEIADALNAELEEWCAEERKKNRVADQLYEGHLAIFPPRTPPPPVRP
jgi:hypothetical protein